MYIYIINVYFGLDIFKNRLLKRVYKHMGIIPKVFGQYTTYGTDLFDAFVE
jgi:hypothetical protein